LKSKIRYAPSDELDFVRCGANVYTCAFVEIKEEKDYKTGKRSLPIFKESMTRIDREMPHLCSEDEAAATRWASRMPLVIRCLDTIERNLAFMGHRLFDWDEVIKAMGWLRAIEEGAEQTLALNQNQAEEAAA